MEIREMHPSDARRGFSLRSGSKPPHKELCWKQTSALNRSHIRDDCRDDSRDTSDWRGTSASQAGITVFRNKVPIQTVGEPLTKRRARRIYGPAVGNPEFVGKKFHF